MDPLWMIAFLVSVLLWSSKTFVFYFKTCLYFVLMMCLAVIVIPVCILKNRGRNVENMRVIRFLVRHVKFILGLRYEVKGLENLQVDGPYVIVSNHQSSLDVLVGLACWLGGTVFINRKRTDDAKSAMAEAARTMLKDQVPIVPVVFSSYSSFYLPKEKLFKCGTVKLTILPAIGTKGMTSDGVSELSQKCYELMHSVFTEISKPANHKVHSD
ncbi:hypothetical protein JZ751_001262 [Albula glossodonta]|uniref:1-acylglycerol-3-phosphate O-acyltransferase n=1 Tax=Albula glossodonta TaxID=121402 RepID=A0A8T2PTB7_9TELE|nr:hypothetical protein JZ751_001262 [Albula glossodonta]